MKNKFLQLVTLAKSHKGWNKTKFIKESKLSASQAHKLSKDDEAIYTCRQPTRDQMAKAIGIDVKYLNERDIAADDYQKYLSVDAKSATAETKTSAAKKTSNPKKSTAAKKKLSTSKSSAATASKKSATSKTSPPKQPIVKKATVSKAAPDKKTASAEKAAATKSEFTNKPPEETQRTEPNKTTARLNKHLELMSKLGEILERYTSQGGEVNEFTQTLKQFSDLVEG